MGSAEKLRERLEEDAYLYLPEFFERELIVDARRSITSKLHTAGLLHPDYPSFEGVIAPGVSSRIQPEVARDNPEVHRVVFGPELLSFFEMLLGGEVLHFDYIWMRAIGPGKGAPPHCDIVYMGRGTHELLTCWIPYGDILTELGGLIVLEGSHLQGKHLRDYLERDVDAYCENRPRHLEMVREGKWVWPGHLSTNPVTLRKKLGGRWLTADWKMGDLITFKMNLIHGSLDNRTHDRLRLSSDTRYQLTSLPVDERWIGPEPIGHSLAGKRGRIC